MYPDECGRITAKNNSKGESLIKMMIVEITMINDGEYERTPLKDRKYKRKRKITIMKNDSSTRLNTGENDRGRDY